MPTPGASSSSTVTHVGSATRFNAGTGLAGAISTTSSAGSSTHPSSSSTTTMSGIKPPIVRQETAPSSLSGRDHFASSPTMHPSPKQSSISTSVTPQGLVKPSISNHAPSSAALASRTKPIGPSATDIRPLADDTPLVGIPGSTGSSINRPILPPSKTSPANSNPASHPTSGPAGSTTGPPPIKPLQTAKKMPPPHQVTTAVVEPGVAEAAAALEKPKVANSTERRISSLTEPQIMEKLRQVVSPKDPKVIYSTIKKIGQG